MLDLTDTVIPKSDQLNADDLLSGPRTFTIKEVRKLNGEQPVAIFLEEFPAGRPYKPCKSMLRVLIECWGHDGSVYPGRRLTLYRDARVRFGPDDVGGIRISHLSHIDKARGIILTVTRGKRATYPVKPLPNDDVPAAAPVTEESVSQLASLREEWKMAAPERRKVIEAEVAELTNEPAPEPAEFAFSEDGGPS